MRVDVGLPNANTGRQMDPQPPADTQQSFSAEELLAMIGAKQVLIERQSNIIARQVEVISRQQAALAELTPSESAGEQTEPT